LGILVIALMPQQGFAATEKPAPGRSIVETIGGCGWLSWLSIGCALKLLSYVAYYVFVIVGWFVGIAGNVLNFALGMTINNAFYTGDSITAVTAGWTFTRDIVNIFFIFALLFIAIATILGIESYGAKKLLSTLIIIALLVNFSLLATQAIIFVTNALAYELYSAVTVTGSKSYLLNSSQKGFDKDITGALMQGLGQQKILGRSPASLDVGPTAGSQPQDAIGTGIAVIVTLVAGIFIMLFAGFIFLAAAFFFAARMAFLWILMILAPFGFVFLILPATKGYAQKWWSALQSQAIFAPAFMFFILITIRISQSDFLKIGETLKNTTSTTELLFLLIMQNLMIFLMLGGGLIVAKTLGIYGADGAMKMATSAGNAFKGYVGRGAARTFIARPASRLQDGKYAGVIGRGLKKFSAIPVVGGLGELASRGLQGASKVGGMEDVAKTHLGFLKSLSPEARARRFQRYSPQIQDMITENMSPRELAEMHNASEKSYPKAAASIDNAIERMSTEKKEKYYDERAKNELKQPLNELAAKWSNIKNPNIRRSVVENANKEQIQKIAKEFDKIGKADDFALDVSTLRKDRINDVLSVIPGVVTRVGATIGKSIEDAVKEIDFEKVDAKHLLDPANSILMSGVVKGAKPSQIQKIVNRGDDVSAKYREELMKYDASGMEDAEYIATELRRLGNAGTANWLETAPARRLLKLK